MSESFAALFEESLKRAEMRTGEVITAEVVRVEHNQVCLLYPTDAAEELTSVDSGWSRSSQKKT